VILLNLKLNCCLHGFVLFRHLCYLPSKALCTARVDDKTSWQKKTPAIKARSQFSVVTSSFSHFLNFIYIFRTGSEIKDIAKSRNEESKRGDLFQLRCLTTA